MPFPASPASRIVRAPILVLRWVVVLVLVLVFLVVVPLVEIAMEVGGLVQRMFARLR